LPRIRKATIKKPYVYLFIFIFIAYLLINFFVNKFYITAPTFLTLNLKVVIPYMLLTILVGFLVAININLIIIKFKELRRVNKSSGFTVVGVFGGMLGGACPGCFVGLFPAFLGLFGITATLSSLPFLGLEILIGSTILLITSIILLSGSDVCKIKYKGEKKQ